MKKMNIHKEKTTRAIKTRVALSSLCEICKEREATNEHHTIFDKETNKSDKNSPIQNICALCHSKIHKTSPNISELRMLVMEYNKVQRVRIMYNNTIRSFSFIEMKTPKFFQEQSDKLNEYEKGLSKKIKKFLEGEIKQDLKNHKSNISSIYSWLKSIKGIGHLLSAQLISYIDINKSPMVSSLWAYAGLTPDSKRQKGKKANWNQELKKVCYNISDSFIKCRTPKYREIYDKEKARQLMLMEKGNQICEDNHSLVVSYSIPKSLGHSDNRARRKAVKEFLKDLWIEWKKEVNNTQKAEVSNS